MSFLFGKRETPREMMRKNLRAINRAIRDIEREKLSLENSEKKIIFEMKQMAKQNQNEVVRVMARDLIRTKKFIKQFIMMKANLNAVSLKLQTFKSINEMSTAMVGVSKSITAMNKQVSIPQMQTILMNFERESEILDTKEELITDAVDSAIGGADEDAETEKYVDGILNELGIALNSELGAINPVQQAAPAAKSQVGVAEGALPSTNNVSRNNDDVNVSNDLRDFEERLKQLRDTK